MAKETKDKKPAEATMDKTYLAAKNAQNARDAHKKNKTKKFKSAKPAKKVKSPKVAKPAKSTENVQAPKATSVQIPKVEKPAQPAKAAAPKAAKPAQPVKVAAPKATKPAQPAKAPRLSDKDNGGMRTKRLISDILCHTLLVVMCIIWVLPFVYLVAHSFRGESSGSFSRYFFPKEWTIENYVKLFTKSESLDFKRMFMNTLFIASCACVISTFMVLSVAYCTSRIKWKMRKAYMNMAMIIGLFPGFMGMVALYFLLKAMGLTEGDKVPMALILCYSAGAGAGFYVMKGYMDTIPKALDEAAYMDGATRFQTYIKIILPLCKPMIVYQIITSFMGPWCDFILGKIICRTNVRYYTVSIGLYTMLDMDHINQWFTRFCAGAVCIAIPISVLYIITQRFYQEAMSGSVKG